MVQIRTDAFGCLTRTFQGKQSSGPNLGAGGPAPFLGGLWAGRGTEMVPPAGKGLWDALEMVTSPGLTYL